MSKISPMSGTTGVSTRTVSADPGLLSHEQLLQRNKGGRRRTLEELIAKEKLNRISSASDQASLMFKKVKRKIRWFVDHAQLKISVSRKFALCLKGMLL